MRYKSLLFASIAIFGLVATAEAQTAPPPPVWNPTIQNKLTWLHPSANTDGSAVAAGELTGEKVYRGVKTDGSDLVIIATLTTASTAYTDNLAPIGQSCYAVSELGTFVVSGSNVTQESAKSAPVCVSKVAPPPPVPNPPANPVTVASVVYTIIKEDNALAMLPVGTVPAGTICDPKQGAIGDGVAYYAVPRSAVSWSGNVRPPIVVSKCTS